MPNQNPRTHQHPKSHPQSALSSQKSISPASPACLSFTLVERWSVSGRLLVGHRSFAGRLVVGHRSVGGRLVVGLKRPSATPAASQSIAKQALAKNQAQQTDIQPNCAHFLRQSAPITQSSALGRKCVGSGSRTVDSMSVQCRLRDASGSVLCRFGVGFLKGKNHPKKYKHSPSKNLTPSPKSPTTPNTILRACSTPILVIGIWCFVGHWALVIPSPTALSFLTRHLALHPRPAPIQISPT